MSNENIKERFKSELINSLKKETEKEIQERVKEFESKLRELASAKIVAFVDSLKIAAKENYNSVAPELVIEVHL